MIAMTDAECAEMLAEFRKLNLGPDLCAALDHAIGALARHPAFTGPLIETHPLGDRVFPEVLDPFDSRMPSVLVGGTMTTTAAQ